MARENASNRPRRTPVRDQYRGRQSVRGKDSNYEYRWVNDEDGRVQLLQEDAWEIVTDQDLQIGDRRVAEPSTEGSPRTISGGNGVTQYLMRIKKEYYEEDLAAKQRQVDQLENATKNDRDGFYGKGISLSSKIS